MDPKEIAKSLTKEEIASLRGQPAHKRKGWIVKRHGSSTEKAAAARFQRFPAWADSVDKMVNWGPSPDEAHRKRLALRRPKKKNWRK